MNFAALRETGGEGKSLPDILLLKVGEVRQQIFGRAAGGNSFHDHADGHAHASNARFSAHDFGIDRDSMKFLHVVRIAQGRAGGRKFVIGSIP